MKLSQQSTLRYFEFRKSKNLSTCYNEIPVLLSNDKQCNSPFIFMCEFLAAELEKTFR